MNIIMSHIGLIPTKLAMSAPYGCPHCWQGCDPNVDDFVAFVSICDRLQHLSSIFNKNDKPDIMNSSTINSASSNQAHFFHYNLFFPLSLAF